MHPIRFLAIALLVASALPRAASALPIAITYTVTGGVAATSGIGPGVPFAGSLTLIFPGGGDVTIGGAIDFGGQITVMSGEIHATGDPLIVDVGSGTPGEITSLVFPSGATSFPFGTGFVNLVGPQFNSFGTIVPGSFTLDADWILAADIATGSLLGTEFSRHVVPEPSTAVLLGPGLAGAALRRRAR